MKKLFLILVAILVTGLYSFGGNYYGPIGGSMLTISNDRDYYPRYVEDPCIVTVEKDQHYYLFADIFYSSGSSIDIDLDLDIDFSGPEHLFSEAVHAIQVPGQREDYKNGTIPEDGKLSYNWEYIITSGTASFFLYCYIY